MHQATIDAITAHDYPVGPPPNAPADESSAWSGTGHGIDSMCMNHRCSISRAPRSCRCIDH